MKRIIALVLALCLMMTLLTSCEKVPKSASEALEQAMELSASSLKKDRSADVMEAAANGGSVEFSMDFTDIFSLLTGTQLENKVGLNVKSYSDKKGTVSASVLGLLIDDRPLVEANMFSDTEKFVMTSEELLGSNAYGATLESIIALLKENVPGFSDATLQNSANLATSAELVGVITKYVKLLSNTLFEVCPAERTTDKLTIGGETVEATSFKINVSAAQAAEVLRKVYDAFKADTHAKEVIDKYIADNGLNTEGTDIYAEFDKAIAELEKSAADSTNSLDVSFDFNSKVGNLMQVRVDFVGSESAGESIALILGVDHMNPTYSAFIVNSNLETVKLEIKTVEDTKEKLKKEITLQYNTSSQNISVTAVLDYDKATGQYLLEFTLPESLLGAKAVISVTGQYMTTNESIVFSADNISLNISGMLSFNINLSAKMTVLAKDNGMPKAPESFKDITNEEVQTELLNEFETNLEEIITLLPEGLLELFYGA